MNAELHAGNLVSSISVEGLLRKRDMLTEKLQTIVTMLAECARLTVEGKMLNGEYRQFDWVICGHNQHYGNTLLSQEGLADIKKRLDAALWGKLMHDSGLLTFMDAKAKAEFSSQVADCKTPPLTRENIEASFKTLYDSRDDIFDRGVINCFKRLSWDYKTNNPVKFGKRIIKRYLVDRWGYSGTNARNELQDLQRVFCLVDGKPEEDHRNDLDSRLSASINLRRKVTDVSNGVHVDAYMEIRWFKNGNGHITFLRPDLVDKLNSIIAKHFPGALAEPRS